MKLSAAACFLPPVLLGLSDALFAQGVLYAWPGPQYGSQGAVAELGDVNGDQIPDFAYTFPPVNPGQVGRVIVRSGANASQLQGISGPAPLDGFGKLIAALGDIDGDQRADFLVAADAYVQARSGASGALIWRVPIAGLASALSLPDLDGDGVPDWASGVPNISSPAPGTVRFHSGRSGATLSTVATPPGASPDFGTCLATAGDFDGDGTRDLLVGDPNGGTGFGAVTVHGIASPGLLGHFNGVASPFASTTTLFGYSVATPGDIDGDSVPEILVGSPGELLAPPSSHGGPTGHVRLLSGATGAQIFDFTQTFSGRGFGLQVSAYPDLDGDGKPELLMTALYEIVGCCAAVPSEVRIHSSATGQQLYFAPDQNSQHIAVIHDINGDGFADFLSPQWGPQNAQSALLILPFVSPYAPAPGCIPKTSSAGCMSWPDFVGAPSVSMGDNLTVRAGGLMRGTFGLFMFGTQPSALPFCGGTLCVAGTVRRSAQMATGGSTACSGSMQLAVSKAELAAWSGGPGSALFVQAWYRDPGFSPPNDVGLSSVLPLAIWP